MHRHRFMFVFITAMAMSGCERAPTSASPVAAGSSTAVAITASVASEARTSAAAPVTAVQATKDATRPASFYDTEFERRPSATQLTQLGRALFADTSLSASGTQACTSCHDPAHAYGPSNGRAVQLGGARLSIPGVRAVPTLMYHQNVPPFTEHFSDTDGDDSIDQGPAGGRTWDGRVSTAHEQAALPLLSPFEMGNASAEAVIRQLERSPNAKQFRVAFGDHVFDHAALAWNGLLLALEVFQQSPQDFYPYSSKYDAFLRAQLHLSPSEQRGLALFNDAGKGNCASCHPSTIKRGAFPQFTDNGFIALGVPRNAAIAANGRRHYYDLGLCGPLRTDLADRHEYCGLFRTPTLRNVASRHAFFHNGAMHSLKDAVKFYVERDARPATVYPRDNRGGVRKFNDLPEPYWANVNTDTPFGGVPGKPALTDADVADMVAFLGTLTDGYVVPKSPAIENATKRP